MPGRLARRLQVSLLRAVFRHLVQPAVATRGWWVQAHGHDQEEVRCRYVVAQRGLAVWDFDLFVAPRLRLGRTFARLWTAVDAQLAAQGVRWTFSQISPFNEAGRATSGGRGWLGGGVA